MQDTKIITKVDYNKNRSDYENITDIIVYTGKTDEYFNYTYGKLEYRKVRWDHEILDEITIKEML